MLRCKVGSERETVSVKGSSPGCQSYSSWLGSLGHGRNLAPFSRELSRSMISSRVVKLRLDIGCRTPSFVYDCRFFKALTGLEEANSSLINSALFNSALHLSSARTSSSLQDTRRTACRYDSAASIVASNTSCAVFAVGITASLAWALDSAT